MAVDLLQRAGLNKYEAEAYVALLSDGPLTGYELGKRSGVPLSKSYETLERLARRGLALIQPGDPPRYTAERPERFLARTRADQESVLSALDVALAEIRHADPADDFWVVRGRANVLAHAASLIAEAQEVVTVGWSIMLDEVSALLDTARARGCRVSVSVLDAPVGREPAPELLALLVDGREALVGALTPAAHCQAVASANPGLVAAVVAVTARTAPRRELVGAGAGVNPGVVADLAAERAADSTERRDADWISWENRKHERLRRLAGGGRVA